MDRRLAFGVLFCVTFGVAACATGGGNVTYPNPLNPTPAPKSSGSGAPTSGPTSTASPSSSCPPSYPSVPASETIPLPAGGGILSIPNFGDFSGTATTSALTKGAGANVTIADSTQQIASPPAPIPTGQTGVFFVELTISQNVTFANPNIPTTITANCTIVPGDTYTANVYALGGPVQSPQQATAVGHSVSFTIVVPLGGSFPGGVPADVVISH